MMGNEQFDGWKSINLCDPGPIDYEGDTWTNASRIRFTGCAADTEMVAIDGVGHTWPGGHQYLSADRIGDICTDCMANERIIEFFIAQLAHR